MKPELLLAGQIGTTNTVGRILAHDVVIETNDGRVRLRKGHILGPDDLPILVTANRSIHLIAMEADDIHEGAAAERIARAVAGAGVLIGEPHESMVTLRARDRGLLSVDSDTLLAINTIPDMSVWTLFDAQIVRARQAIAGVKVTPLVTSLAAVGAAEAIASDAPGIIDVLPFAPRRVGVLVREELIPAAGERFREAITSKVEWFGSEITAIVNAENDVAGVTAAWRQLADRGSDMILCAGVTSTDPLDVTVQALDALAVRWEKRGVPAHPGSTYWLAYRGDIPILGMASCGMFSRATVLDLILPRFFAGQRVDARTLAALGHGGLLNKGMAFRFPDYASPEIAATEDE